MLVNIARERGEVGYLGDGQNRIATVHVDDLAELFVLAAECGKPGAVYNGAGGDIATAELAGAVAAGNPGVAALSYTPATPERAAEVWGPFPSLVARHQQPGERRTCAA